MPNTATLTVNLSALRANYRLLASRLRGECASVVKANAYGLGVETVSAALWEEGCRTFFVATLEEGVALRAVLPEAQIYVFHGMQAREEKEFAAHRLMPVLNSAQQLARWREADQRAGAALHIDTGINRLGLNESELAALTPEALKAGNIQLILSHLACSHDPGLAKNQEQFQRFERMYRPFAGVAKASLANSGGIFLSNDFHYDLARPGCALYGIAPAIGDNPMQHVATLSAPLLQVRGVEEDCTVGYAATYDAKKGSRLAVVALGYADGYMRSQSNRGHAYIAGHKVPIAGRVSMDMIVLDVSSVPESAFTETTRAEFINEHFTVNHLADECGTIGYEIFTRIGRRVTRVYR